MQDSPLSITGSIVGIVALLISVIAITQALSSWATAYRNAPSELKRFTSSISNTVDSRAFRLKAGHVPGAIGLQFSGQRETEGLWSQMLEEYFNAHLELEEELRGMREKERGLGWLSWLRVTWLFRRKDLDESVRRVETLRLRKMAVSLNALIADMETIKDTLQRIESRIPEGRINLPPPRPPRDEERSRSPVRPLRMYPSSLFGESVDGAVRTSLDSR